MHVGQNMPCVQKSIYGLYSEQNSTKYMYSANDTVDEAVLYFDKIANWGMFNYGNNILLITFHYQ